MFPIDAAVMPFPNEETTPPVTKTYFDIQTSRAVLEMLPGWGGPLNLRLDFGVEHDHLRFVFARRSLNRQLGLGLCNRHRHLFEEAIQGIELQLQAWDLVVHGHHE